MKKTYKALLCGAAAVAAALGSSALRYDAALAALFFCAVLSLRGDTVAGLSPGHAAATFLVRTPCSPARRW